jgi:uncharacterized damage-inducible protein DinB
VIKTYRTGAVGALMDEYERAVAELTRVLESISEEEYERIRDTETEDEACRSIQTIMSHVIGAGYGYAGMYRQAWGLERNPWPREKIAKSDVVPKLQDMLRYTAETLDGRWDLTEAEGNAMRIPSPWEQVYDFEQLFEHAIVHVLRHRRQIERFLER